MDLYGKALNRYFEGEKKLNFTLYNNIGGLEILPVSVYFDSKLNLLESKALDLCKGEILDIGAGSGRHSLLLKEKGFTTKAIDLSEGCVSLMKQQGLDAEHWSIFDYPEDRKYDTLFLMMNGIGLAGKLDRVALLLEKLKKHLKPEGQVIFDSSDIAHLFGDAPIPLDRYYGEVKFQFEFEKEKGEWFDWVYIDPVQMKFLANTAGFDMGIIYTDNYDQYLAKLSLS